MSIRRFPATSGSAGAARQFTRECLPEDLPAPGRDALVLMVSELASNCIRHAHTDFTITVRYAAGQVCVDVTDDAPGSPRVRTGPATMRGGHGLRIIDRLSTAWGVTPLAGRPGKTVWFTVDSPVADGANDGQAAAPVTDPGEP